MLSRPLRLKSKCRSELTDTADCTMCSTPQRGAFRLLQSEPQQSEQRLDWVALAFTCLRLLLLWASGPGVWLGSLLLCSHSLVALCGELLSVSLAMVCYLYLYSN